MSSQDVRARIEFPDGATYLVSPEDGYAKVQVRETLRPIQRLRQTGAMDVGEIVYREHDSNPVSFNRRTVRRYIRAYNDVYLGFLPQFAASRERSG